MLSRGEESNSSYESQPEEQNMIINEDGVNEFDEPNEDKITAPFLTKYEKARVIGVRAVQISKNAPLYYNIGENNSCNDPISIAEKELKEGRIPFIIRRYLPDGSFEDWKLSQLKRFD